VATLNKTNRLNFIKVDHKRFSSYVDFIKIDTFYLILRVKVRGYDNTPQYSGGG